MLGALLHNPVAMSESEGAVVAPLPSPQFTVRFAVGGVSRLEYMWPKVSLIADEVLSQTFARLKLCKCDL